VLEKGEIEGEYAMRRAYPSGEGEKLKEGGGGGEKGEEEEE